MWSVETNFKSTLTLDISWSFLNIVYIWVKNVRENQPTQIWWSRNIRKLKPQDTGAYPALSYCAHHCIMRTWSVLCHNPITERPSRVSYLSVSDLAEDRVHFCWRASCDLPCIYQAIQGLTLPWSTGPLHHTAVPGLTRQPNTGLTSTGREGTERGPLTLQAGHVPILDWLLKSQLITCQDSTVIYVIENWKYIASSIEAIK